MRGLGLRQSRGVPGVSRAPVRQEHEGDKGEADDLEHGQAEAGGRFDADELDEEPKPQVGEEELLEEGARGGVPGVGAHEIAEQAQGEEGLVELGGMAVLAVAEVDAEEARGRFAIATGGRKQPMRPMAMPSAAAGAMAFPWRVAMPNQALASLTPATRRSARR